MQPDPPNSRPAGNGRIDQCWVGKLNDRQQPFRDFLHRLFMACPKVNGEAHRTRSHINHAQPVPIPLMDAERGMPTQMVTHAKEQRRRKRAIRVKNHLWSAFHHIDKGLLPLQRRFADAWCAKKRCAKHHAAFRHEYWVRFMWALCCWRRSDPQEDWPPYHLRVGVVHAGFPSSRSSPNGISAGYTCSSMSSTSSSVRGGIRCPDRPGCPCFARDSSSSLLTASC
jgi:hypothetical protein